MTDTKTAKPKDEKPAPRMLEKYRAEIAPAMREQFGYSNPMMIPQLQKIVLNMGVGRALENKNRIDHAVRELGVIAGQRPVITKARKSVAGFKLREVYAIGCSVTLRGDRMWEFLDRLVTLAVPRIRDFRGLSAKLDGQGNYTMGLSEQSVFPEIILDKVEFIQGMNITFVTTAETDEEGYALLSSLGMPYKK